MPQAVPDFSGLVAGGKPAMAAALAAIERTEDSPDVITLLDKAWANARAHVVGLTGPPGVGKSTLTNALIKSWRAEGKTVGVIAVDPSSKRSGGALLGDRTRLLTDPEDEGIFVRSMAARDRLGGVASLTYAAMVLMRSVYDIVLIETVGVGQSETDVVTVADTVIFCIQPGSGDSLQFMKAGIMEVPHIALVTKGDLGAAAQRALADFNGALGLAEGGEWKVPSFVVSATTGLGIDQLGNVLSQRWKWLVAGNRLTNLRQQQDSRWLEEAVRDRFGRAGLGKATGMLELGTASPFRKEAEIAEALDA